MIDNKKIMQPFFIKNNLRIFLTRKLLTKFYEFIPYFFIFSAQTNYVREAPLLPKALHNRFAEAPRTKQLPPNCLNSTISPPKTSGYIMQHGTPGENGLMQGYLEMLGIPHSGCNAFVAAITFDKYSTKSYLKDVDFVKCADDIFIRKGESTEGLAQKAVEKLGLPMFVKPTDGGSSFGVTKVKTVEDFDKAVEHAFSEGNMIIAEGAIVGRELTCAVYNNGKEIVALPVIEIITENEFFDYEAKYNGHSREVCPAQIPDTLRDEIQAVSKKIYSHLGCAGLVRVDYISAEDGLYFLEVNTIPGMTAASLVPQMVRAAGMDMTNFLTAIIENS